MMHRIQDDKSNRGTVDWLTPTQAAVQLECSVWTIRKMLIEGKLKAKRADDQVFVRIDDAVRKEALANPTETAPEGMDLPAKGDDVLADMLAYTMGKARGICGTSDMAEIS